MKYYKFQEKSQDKLPIGKIICLARTYKKHAEEMKTDVTKKPLLFLKPASSVIYNGETVIIPKLSKKIHHEVELGIVIGKKGKNIKKNVAMDYVLGYVIGLDITARDMQTEAKEKGWPWSISKGFDTFAPISNIVLKERISDPLNKEIWLKVNDKIRQKSNTNFMIFKIEEIIEFISRIMTLEKGDLILTGTPEGVSEIRNKDIIKAGLGDILSLTINVKNER
mgnify:CR=1 FL=1